MKKQITFDLVLELAKIVTTSFIEQRVMNRLGKRVIHKIDYVLTEYQHFRELIEWNGDFLTLVTSENVMYV